MEAVAQKKKKKPTNYSIKVLQYSIPLDIFEENVTLPRSTVARHILWHGVPIRLDQLAKPTIRSRYAHTLLVTEQGEGPMDTVASTIRLRNEG